MKYFKTQTVKGSIINRKNRFSQGHKWSFTFRIAILFIFINSLGCSSEIGPFPNEPFIALKGPITKLIGPDGKDSIIQITFDFTDGDGDIGLGTFDTMVPYNFGSAYFYNLLVDVKQQIDGKMKPIQYDVIDDTVNFNSRIPIITPTGKEKAIEGEFTLNIYADMNARTQPDSVKFSLFIYDRAKHKSNVIETDVIFIDK
jgi:hypothetical protein